VSNHTKPVLPEPDGLAFPGGLYYFHKSAQSILEQGIQYGREQALAWDEKDDQWTTAIDESHPLKTKAYAAYDTAMEMVGNRRTKGSLVDLVCWLIQEKDRGREQMRDECIAAVEDEHLPSYGEPASQRDSDDFSYDMAIQDATKAIRKIP